MTTTAHEAQDSHGHEHPKFLAHHFETPQQQFDSGKLGVWLFLTTEVLLFSGLFCAYAVYRANHPEVFAYAHLYLDKKMGAINTIVLILSSFTMAWGVTAIQLGQRRLCMFLLGITIVCGAGFMCVKYVEYSAKWKHHLLPGQHYQPELNPAQAEAEEAGAGKSVHGSAGAATVPGEGATAENKAGGAGGGEVKAGATAAVAGVPTGPTTRYSEGDNQGYLIEQSAIPRAATGPAGINDEWEMGHVSRFAQATPAVAGEHIGPEPYNTHIFFGIYFLMTGLHGIHVLGGMALIGWVLWRVKRGDFGPEYFSPVDFVGLYWHIVDLIWIFLFPLLYLIGNSPS